MLQWYYFALLSSVMLGLYSIIEKGALKKEHATAFSSAFSLIAAVFSLPFLVFAKYDLSVFQLVLIFINSIVIALTYLLAARVYKHGSISAASSAFSALPSVFVVLLALPMLGELLSLLQYFSIAVITVLIYFLLFERNMKNDFESNKYRTMVVTRSFLVAVGALITKYLLFNVNVFTFLVFSEVFIAFDFMVFISIKYNGVKEIIDTVKLYSLPIVSMALLTVGYGLTYYISLISAPVSLVTPVRNTVYIVIAVLVGGVIFREGDLKKKLLLSIVLLIFAYLLIL